MKTRLRIVATGMYIVVVGALVSAQEPSEHEKHHPAGDSAQKNESPAPEHGGKGMMGEMCAMMQKDMDAMHAAMKDEETKIEGLVKDMNEATGSAKVDAIAAAVTEMAAACKKMRATHEDMMSKMMEHMSEHMMQGKGESEKSEMMMCPMMKDHSDSDSHAAHGDGDTREKAPGDANTDDHSAHHPKS